MWARGCVLICSILEERCLLCVRWTSGGHAVPAHRIAVWAGQCRYGIYPRGCPGSSMRAAGMVHAQLLGQVSKLSSLQEATPSSRHR